MVDPALDTIIRFFSGDYDESEARRLLGTATARHLYYLGERREADGRISYGHHPACAAGLMREIHIAQGGENSPLQAAFEYSDGMGTVLVTKAQAEPEHSGGPLRWIANGKTILNNKGKPVKQYEPYFSEAGHRFEEPREVGVTPIMYYDAAGRLVRTELPDGTFNRVEFAPWHVTSFDPNDTVLEPGNAWYARYVSGTPEERRAAHLAELHANTPAMTHLDSLGREVIAIAHNRVPEDSPELHNVPLLDRPWRDERYLTFTKLDAEGKPLWIRDARGNRVMEYINRPGADTDYAPCYDIAGNLLFQHSMDAGDRWMLMDAAGKPMVAWDFNQRQTDGGPVDEHRYLVTEYDALHRPVNQWLRINGERPLKLVEHFVYSEPPRDDEAARTGAKASNLLGQVRQHYDPGGLMTNERFDFKGNLLEVTRQVASDYRAPVIDWSEGSPTAGLEEETLTQITEYDALNRMTRLYNWHRGEGSRVAVYEPRYNARGVLEGEEIVVGATKTATGYEEMRPADESRPGQARRPVQRTAAVSGIRYNAKGQRQRIGYGNGTETRYDYDPQTFRLRQLRTTRPATDLPFPVSHSNLRDERVVQQLSYTYDPVGNITEIHDEAYEPVFFRKQRVEPRSRYTYDGLYRLIEATGRENSLAVGPPGQFDTAYETTFPTDHALRNYTQRYHYDSVGNFVEMRHTADGEGWTRSYETASDSNRLLRTWEGADTWDSDRATSKTEYRYDTHGSMLNIANVAPGQFLRWDYRDMIHSLDLVGGGWAYYQYDAGKQRTRKRIERLGGEVEERLYLGGMEVYRQRRNGGLVEEIETHHLFVDDQRVLLVDDVLETDNDKLGVGMLYRYQYGNHLGSVALELDADAAIISYEEYHPYGTTAYQATGRDVRATAKRYRYTGMERDEETGLNYHTARFYAIWLAKWISTDPLGASATLNAFEYCRSSPVAYIDREGTYGGNVSPVGPNTPFRPPLPPLAPVIPPPPAVPPPLVPTPPPAAPLGPAAALAEGIAVALLAVTAFLVVTLWPNSAGGYEYSDPETGEPHSFRSQTELDRFLAERASRLSRTPQDSSDPLIAPGASDPRIPALAPGREDISGPVIAPPHGTPDTSGPVIAPPPHGTQDAIEAPGDSVPGERRAASRRRSDVGRVSRQRAMMDLREALESETLTPRQREAVDLITEEYGPEAVEYFREHGTFPEGTAIENSHPYSVQSDPEIATRPGDLVPRRFHRYGVHPGDTRPPLHGEPLAPSYAEESGFLILGENGVPIGQMGTEYVDEAALNMCLPRR